ncbi:MULTISPECIES: YciI family protein [unclassified Phenylobacterium]|uniref:YciI family protein n=1 Tax=unclassified Phenylobacterium TaxID=2640670 RepID=UPI001E63A488|nr:MULTISPECIES: YciI family protein [unclassified Phenylobacterium]
MFMVRSGHREPPTPELLEAMGDLVGREMQAGRLIDTGGLMPPAMGAEISVKDGKVHILDGPYVESKEVVGGYAIFELSGKDEALVLATEFMEMHAAHLPGWEGTCDLRMMATA